jgi:hypothetical protein
MIQLTSPTSPVFIAKPPVARLLKNFPKFYGTRKFITVLTKFIVRSLSWATLIQCTLPHHIHIRPISILFSRLRLILPGVCIYSGFRTETLYALLFLTCLLHTLPNSIIFDFMIIIVFGEEHKLWGSFAMECSAVLLFCIPLRRILFSEIQMFPFDTLFSEIQMFSSRTLFSDTLSPYSSFNVRDQF